MKPIISIKDDVLLVTVDDGSGARRDLRDLVESPIWDASLNSTLYAVIDVVADLASESLRAFAKGGSDDVKTAWICADWLAEEIFPKLQSRKISLPEDVALKVSGVLSGTRNSAALQPILDDNPDVLKNTPKFPEVR